MTTKEQCGLVVSFDQGSLFGMTTVREKGVCPGGCRFKIGEAVDITEIRDNIACFEYAGKTKKESCFKLIYCEGIAKKFDKTNPAGRTLKKGG